ncbi:putative protein-serine/threonine phosphatase [Lupinus albus]|uniref:Protein phosphatase n=1 Tax=Lupinus albus TaxID=3870 RepID=A0A6A4QUH8_LUPAL|nr:putative protein-serine/threonine phosphatase [Lupinus albus]
MMMMIVPESNAGHAGAIIQELQNVAAERKLKMIVRGHYIPKGDPERPRGEDAFFILEEEQTIGVADGVGGWSVHGIDAGDYARELMKNAMKAVGSEPKGLVDPKSVLNKAFLSTKSQGSSTASIVTLKNNMLHGVNVGDSRLRLFRKNSLFYESPIQQHKFNKPYQLGNHECSDKPNIADEYQVSVKEGDIVVMGSDGLWDNLYPNEIVEILWQNSLGGMLDIQGLATFIAKLAFNKSKKTDIATPFSVAAQEAGYGNTGGKIDDITVFVAYIDFV